MLTDFLSFSLLALSDTGLRAVHAETAESGLETKVLAGLWP